MDDYFAARLCGHHARTECCIKQLLPQQAPRLSATVQTSVIVPSAAGWLCVVPDGFAPVGHVLDAPAAADQLLTASVAGEAQTA